MNNSDVQCPHCKSVGKIITDYHEGQTICLSCSYIVSRRIQDTGAEYNNYANESKRTAYDPKRADQVYDFSKEFGNMGCVLPGPKDLAQKFTNLLNSSTDKRLQQGQRTIDQFCNALNLKQYTKNEAIKIYNDIKKYDSFKGKNKNAICAAIIQLTLKIQQTPLTLTQICEPIGVKVKQAKQAYKQYKWDVADLQYINASTYVRKYCKKLNIKFSQKDCSNLVTRINKEGILDGRNPKTIASVAISIISFLQNNNVQIKNIADQTGMNENTIKNSLKKTMPFIQDLIPNISNQRRSIDDLIEKFS